MAEPLIDVSRECLDDELIAAFIDGRLGRKQHVSVAEHLARCENCCAVFAETVRMQAEDDTSIVVARPPLWTRLWVPASAVLAAAACLLLLAWLKPFNKQPWPQPELTELVAAVGQHRYVEPRLTGGFSYAPAPSSVRTGEPERQIRQPDVRIAAAQIEKEVSAHRTSATLHAFGLSLLLTDSAAKAVPALEEAADQEVPSATVLADLAAAYLGRATEQQHPEDVAKALATAEKAIKADPNLVEAWFNRALALERLPLTAGARQAWQDYLRHDPKSAWSREAQQHIDILTEKLQSRSLTEERQQVQQAVQSRDPVVLRRVSNEYPVATRQWLEDELLDVWPKGELRGDSSIGPTFLASAIPLARIVREQTGDTFWVDAVSAVDASLSSPGARDALARAQALFLQARTEYTTDQFRSAAEHFGQAILPLEKAQSPFADFARLYLAFSADTANDQADASRRLDLLLPVTNKRGYLRLVGSIHRTRGRIHGVRGEWGAALEEYQLALNCFLQTKDADNIASMHASIAEGLDFLGEPQSAWLHRSAALAELDRLVDPRRRHTILLGAALSSTREALPETALHFQNAVLDNAFQWRRPPAIVEGHLYRATLLQKLGQTKSAAHDLQEAARAQTDITEPGMAARMRAFILLTSGEIDQRANPEAAVQSLTQALDLFAKMGTGWPETSLYLARGRAQLGRGRPDLAEADLLKGIEAFELQRQKLELETQRSSYFEQPWDIFGEMIRFQAVERNQSAKALLYAERARARTLLEQIIGAPQAEPLDPDAIVRALPPSVHLVYYAVLEDRLLVWVLGKSGVRSAQSPVSAEELARSVIAFRSALENGTTSADVRQKSSRLYDQLIRPIAGLLAKDSKVVIVPDGPLNAVPFAALLDRETSRYLIQDHPVALTPSGTILARASRQLVDVEGQSLRSALIMGNPETGGRDRDLPNLPEAEAEARDISALYPATTLLIGAEATKDRFLQEAGRHDVVHFAGHAVANTDHPNLSRLLFAGPDANETTSLFVSELVRTSYPKTRLVVLAACGTGLGVVRRGEGVLTLARAFLAAGVPTVVASLWNLDDRASRTLFEAFHASIRGGAGPTEALRNAQLDLLTSSDLALQAPTRWAGVVAIGK